MMYGFDLTGRIALVTGGSRGLGRAMVLAFAKAGADVVVTSRKEAACETVAQEVRALGRKALALPAHVGRWDELDRLVERVYDQWGRIDILVNNAGMSPVEPDSAATSEAMFDKIVGVNFKGPFRLAALVGSKMASGQGGTIINISSLGAMSPEPGMIPYAAAKAALNAMTVGLARELAPRVRVNTISPGMFETDIAKAWESPEALASMVPLRRLGQPEEIVGAALYLASDAASYTTGANLAVGGGIESPR